MVMSLKNLIWNLYAAWVYIYMHYENTKFNQIRDPAISYFECGVFRGFSINGGQT